MKSLKMPRQLTLCIFIFSSVGNLAGKFVGGHILAMCTKPLIVPSLALFCWLLLKENDVRGCKVATLMLAMAFGALGGHPADVQRADLIPRWASGLSRRSHILFPDDS